MQEVVILHEGTNVNQTLARIIHDGSLRNHRRQARQGG